jgi:Protein of unknown function DUF47.
MGKKKNYNYFEKFIELINYSCRSAEQLHKVLEDFHPDLAEEKAKELHEIEHAADDAKHDMMTRLAKEFITPIEREHIITLSQQIDDITDSIEEVLIKIHIFNVKKIKPEVLEFTRLIIRLCNTLKEVLKEFPNFKKSTTLFEKIIEVNQLEEEGDRLYFESIRRLYNDPKDPVELLIWTKIFDVLELCCDSCEITADTIESVAMNNS